MTDYLHDRVVTAIGVHYLIEGEIGRGSSGVVYRGTDLRLNRAVAVKVLPPELAYNPDVRERFVREAQTSAHLTHPHIVPIYSVDEREGLVYFVMALVEGESARALLTREPQWPLDRAVQTMRDVADALSYAHLRGVVHRDIKPDNILIERGTGRAMVTDFGIARATAGDTRLTVTGATIGTPAYMSPEQALGERELDGRSDVYSLGVVGYQMLAGAPPFSAPTTVSMLMKHVQERPSPIRERRSDIPASLAIIIDRALEKDPQDRWASAAELRDALDGKIVVAQRPRWGADAPLSGPPALPIAEIPPIPADRAPSPHPLFAHQPDQLRYVEQQYLPQPLQPPAGLSGGQLKRWYREQFRAQRSLQHLQRGDPRQLGLMIEANARGRGARPERPLWQRVDAFRSSVFRLGFVGLPALGIGFLMSVGTRSPVPLVLTGIWNAILLSRVISRGDSIYADGIGPIEALRKGLRTKLRAMEPQPTEAAMPIASSPGAPAIQPFHSAPDPAASLVPPEVLAGAYGDRVRRAVADRDVIRDIVGRLSGLEKDMLPDVSPTVEGLTSRVASLAITLHRLDSDVSGTSLGSLDERIAALKRESASAERERRLALLERQRLSLNDLLERRQTLANQLESATIALQNLKFDLLKLRSAGVNSAIHDVTSVTQEARAVSRDISRLLEVADDLRKI